MNELAVMFPQEDLMWAQKGKWEEWGQREQSRQWGQWAGRDLGPLPHESALTIFWRFCWRNALDPEDIRDWFASSGQTIDWPQLKAITGWRCPQVVEVRIDRLPSRELLFDGGLRYCPVCLECCYHSVWHQFVPVHSCPLHDVPLMSCCSVCGHPCAKVSEYLNCRLAPFGCKSCGEYLAGAAPDLDSHLDLRDQSAVMRERLDGYQRWIMQNHELLDLAGQLYRPSGWSAAEPSAFHDLVYRLIDQFAPTDRFRLGDGRRVQMFIWQILPYRRYVMRHEFHTRRSALGAYRNALHKLLRHYGVRHSDGSRLREAGSRIAARQPLNVRALGAPLVALALTRHWIEGELWYVSRCTDAREALLSRPMPFSDSGIGRYLRIEVQAYVSALYAAFLDVAVAALHQTGEVSPRGLLAAGQGVGFTQSRQAGWITGMAIFTQSTAVASSPLRMYERLLFDPTSAPSDAELTRECWDVPLHWYLRPIRITPSSEIR
ncbi:hypothetical protein ACFQ3P_04525 [Paraburkholderia sabiae]|uniref:TniQ protein n=1 Tax=Paraburkholderia sabiae TaxID=273251 RepID=A0ABU9QMJ2_9BURK|nr:hypothetical protein [Paraburkholderia sabiae]WJZ79130.1 hypothetical protein QEN71_34730 [Paraburkholderia sabiae]CAD6514387.1 hypothetical protein LMG24235_00907 [Paraburkholderia sabiae]